MPASLAGDGEQTSIASTGARGIVVKSVHNEKAGPPPPD